MSEPKKEKTLSEKHMDMHNKQEETISAILPLLNGYTVSQAKSILSTAQFRTEHCKIDTDSFEFI